MFYNWPHLTLSLLNTQYYDTNNTPSNNKKYFGKVNIENQNHKKNIMLNMSRDPVASSKFYTDELDLLLAFIG